MSSREGRFARAIRWWVDAVSARPLITLLLLALLTAGAFHYSRENLRIDSDTADLIRQKTEWRQDYDAYKAAFPQRIKTSVLVVRAPSRETAADLARELAERLEQDPHFDSVFAPANLEYLRRHALLYLDADELENLLNRLAELQPVITSLAEQPNLQGLFSVLVQGLEETAPGEPLPEELGQFMARVDQAGEAILAGEPATATWWDLLGGDDAGSATSLVVVKGARQYGETLPNKALVASIREHIEAVKPLPEGVEIGLTGRVPLDHEDMVAATTGVKVAGLASLVLLAVILLAGVRSLLVILAIYLSLGVGLIWTGAFTALTLGSFNPISVVFLVMFIGLGVDFAIHYCLRYQEYLQPGTGRRQALAEGAGHAGPAISLCALTSALGFMAFVPTAYRGLAELGIISAGGMFIALFLSFTLIPALFAISRRPRPITPGAAGGRSFLDSLWGHRHLLLGVLLVLTAGAGWLSSQLSFNFSTLALRDPQSPAMETLRELQAENATAGYGLHALVGSSEEARTLAERLEALPVVADVQTWADAVPTAQDEKLQMLADAGFFLFPFLNTPVREQPLAGQERQAALRELLGAAQPHLDPPAGKQEPTPPVTLADMTETLRRIQQHPESHRLLAELEQALVGDASTRLAWLQEALTAGPVQAEALPQPLRERMVSADGRQLITILPAEDITHFPALKRFIEQVRAELPSVTGRPMTEYGVGVIVVEAFQQALLVAIGAISLVLWLALRRLRDMLLVYVPLVLTLVFTFATAVLLGEGLNMANIIVLPLIFGLGVDNGIHVIKRFREEAASFGALMNSSTPRAIALSALTTLGTFGTLMLSPHQGMYSIGLLLTLAISYQLLFTLLVLPLILAWLNHRRLV